jgi:5-(carboxyamino)imidazole ribonucleotide synthase
MVNQRNVGILGGGQLARMLAESAHRLGLTPVPLAETADSPAALLCPRAVVGTLGDEAALKRFFSETDVVIFENEFIDTDLLQRAALAAGGRARFSPSLATLNQLRDKLGQKELLRGLAIPSAPFHAYPGGDLATWIGERAAAFGGRCVLKWGRMGYDGKGVFFLRDPKADLPAAEKFCRWATDRSLTLFAEQAVEFRRELALVACRSTTSEFLAYPLVISEQRDGICLDVTGPATAFGVSPEIERRAQEHARRIAEAARLEGCFALEFFERPDGDLWVNEMAPRVHNSGHYTQEACTTSQFENHLRATLGLPLGKPTPRAAFVMGNLLGPAGVELDSASAPLPVPGPELQLHWYGKRDIRGGRKLGHLNGIAASRDALGPVVAAMRENRASWERSLRELAEEKGKS